MGSDFRELSVTNTFCPDLLDCTLRDGSYCVDFQFGVQETSTIVSALDDLGFPYIEVGHGIGLGASSRTKWVAACSDEEYVAAAVTSVKRSKCGVFCIPGIATLDDVRKVADSGIQFIRIGTDVDRISEAEPFIALAQSLQIEVFSNIMKSYLLRPEQFATCVQQVMQQGVGAVYIVDSAGGMLPHELSNYFHAVKEVEPNAKLAFHGHNNLGLAVANSLLASQLGFCLVDVTLQGFGRSGGNTSAEQLISALCRADLEVGIDPVECLQVSEALVRPLIEKRGLAALDVAAGLSLFHSSFLPDLLEFSKKERVNPLQLMRKVGDQRVPLVTRESLERAARLLPSSEGLLSRAMSERYCGNEEVLIIESTKRT